ncbi:MAG: signal peptidase I [Candidatus Tectomicrobia bacterium]|uniref:Signal peptidase I n=1 Tax=Tectimicrobiota bacterium TaxID=2528274 RepID=A0A932G1W7_UNCTE|nr:signal peptidase I [Candidatus Tectomicrobia bacterium]
MEEKALEIAQVEDVIQRKSVVREYAEALVYAIILALVIRTFVVQAFKIPSGSMIPTLLSGDHILVNKFIYGVKVPFTDTTLVHFKKPQRGDIIVFKYPEDEKRDFIKRVVGLPGETVEIHNKQVYINGKALKESYTIYRDEGYLPDSTSPRDNYGPTRISAGHLFVMGDNRDNSMDSRFWGFLDETKIKGKAFLIYFSWNGEQHGVRWKRIGDLIR